MNIISEKSSFLAELLKVVESKIASAKSSIDSTTESKNSVSKSSAGDKHETGRAMMERELALSVSQLQKALLLKNDLEKVSLQKAFEKVEFGALVTTNQGKYFMCVGLGKVVVGEESCWAISGGSPMGLALSGKLKGDKVNFQSKSIEIIDLE